MKYPVILQHEEMDCGAACLAMICKFFGLKMPLIKYRELLDFDNNGTSIYNIINASNKLNLIANPLKGNFVEFIEAVNNNEIVLPCIALMKKENFLHYVVIYKITDKYILVADPGEGLCKYSYNDFKSIYMNAVITFKKSNNFQTENYNRKGISFIINLIKKNTKLLMIIFFFSIFVTIISIFGNMVLEYTISNSIVHEDECTDEDCNVHIKEHEQKEESFTANINNIFNSISNNLETVIFVGIIAYIIKLIIELIRSYVISVWTSKTEYELTNSYFNRLINLPLKAFKDRKAGDFLARFTDIRQMNSFIIEVTTIFVLNITYFIGFGIVLLLLSFKLFIINIITMLIFSIVVILYQKKIKRSNHKTLQENTNIVSHLEESIKGIHLIKTMGVSDTKLKNFEISLGKYTSNLQKLVELCYTQNNVINFLTSVSNLLVMYLGIKLCFSGVITVSTLIMYYIMSSYFMTSFSRLLSLQPQFTEAMVVFERVEDIIESEVDCVEGLEIEEIKSIELENISYKYGINNVIFNDITLHINKGEKIVLAGKNGCGKSTLANIIAGNYSSTSGFVKYNGNINVSKASIKNNITYIDQNTFLFHDTIYNNIVLGCKKVNIKKFQEICNLTKVNDFVKLLPGGYDTLLCDNGENLSSGQKQKIALARALLRDTPIYILDEATSNLDAESEKEICEILKYNFVDKTLIIITHNDVLQQIGEKKYILQNGKLNQV